MKGGTIFGQLENPKKTFFLQRGKEVCLEIRLYIDGRISPREGLYYFPNFTLKFGKIFLKRLGFK